MVLQYTSAFLRRIPARGTKIQTCCLQSIAEIHKRAFMLWFQTSRSEINLAGAQLFKKVFSNLKDDALDVAKEKLLYRTFTDWLDRAPENDPLRPHETTVLDNNSAHMKREKEIKEQLWDIWIHLMDALTFDEAIITARQHYRNNIKESELWSLLSL